MSSRSLTGPIDRNVQNLPEDVFKNRPDQRKNAFHNKLLEVQELINAGEYQEALNKLIHDIRAKTDGSVDGKSNDDWITDPTMQMELCALINELIAYLEALTQP